MQGFRIKLLIFGRNMENKYFPNEDALSLNIGSRCSGSIFILMTKCPF